MKFLLACYFALLLAAGWPVSVSFIQDPGEECEPCGELSEIELEVLKLINRKRVEEGLKPLRAMDKLINAARSHSRAMARRRYLAHRLPNGPSLAERLRRAGIARWRRVGENIAMEQGHDDPAGFVVGNWLRSPQHAANITNNDFLYTGIGVVRARDGSHYFTQVFLAP